MRKLIISPSSRATKFCRCRWRIYARLYGFDLKRAWTTDWATASTTCSSSSRQIGMRRRSGDAWSGWRGAGGGDIAAGVVSEFAGTKEIAVPGATAAVLADGILLNPVSPVGRGVLGSCVGAMAAVEEALMGVLLGIALGPVGW